jgi:hypothetical protein
LVTIIRVSDSLLERCILKVEQKEMHSCIERNVKISLLHHMSLCYCLVACVAFHFSGSQQHFRYHRLLGCHRKRTWSNLTITYLPLSPNYFLLYDYISGIQTALPCHVIDSIILVIFWLTVLGWGCNECLVIFRITTCKILFCCKTRPVIRPVS